MNLDGIIGSRKLVVCCGSGGVGKTTTASAMALEAARRGRKVLVLTIDPARRLADSLGVRDLTNIERPVDPCRFREAGIEVAGELHALMLDPKATFDDLIRRLSPDSATTDRVLGNRVYQLLTTALAGVLEYTAVEKLFDIHRKGVYDLIVLDTPPTKNALDFLDAPSKLVGFLDERVMRWFVPAENGSGKLRHRLAQRTGRMVWTVLGRVFGSAFIEDLGEFFASIQSMTGAFRTRALEIERLLTSQDTSFVIVTSGDPSVTEDALYLHRKLREHRMPFGGFIVNRLSPDGGPLDPDMIAREIEALPGDVRERPEMVGLVRKLEDGYGIIRKAGAVERRTMERLRAATGFSGFLARVPQFSHDVHDVGGLVLIGTYLFGDGLLLSREA